MVPAFALKPLPGVKVPAMFVVPEKVLVPPPLSIRLPYEPGVTACVPEAAA